MEKIIVFKCGGSSITELSPEFFNNIKKLKDNGWKPVIVHGGGPAIQQMLDQLKVSFEFINGLRKTTEEMISVIEMVLSGQVNPQLTRYVNSFDIPAVGLTGSDLQLLEAKPIDLKTYGLVGKITNVNTVPIKQLINENIVPIISPVAIDTDMNRYNVNADTAAGAIANALEAESLVFVTDVPGILKDDKLLDEVSVKEIEELIQSEHIYGGMLPKVEAAMKGLTKDISEVMIVNGLASELNKNHTLKGTTILRGENN